MYEIVRVYKWVFKALVLDWLTIHTFGCHHRIKNGRLSVRGVNDENVKRITQCLHGKPFCMNKKSEKPQVMQGILYL